MKRILVIVLVITLLLPSFIYGEGASKDWVVEQGYFGIGGLNLDNKLNRASFATLTVRLVGLEDEALDYKGKSGFKDIENFQGGWANGYVSIAKEKGLMSGKSKEAFDPIGNVTYIEMLTVLMRVLGYEDGVDFVKYPDDYYKKALEIGLGDMFVPLKEEVYRKTVLDTMVKVLNTNLKGEDYTLFYRLDSVPKKETPMGKITVENIRFNTTISGLFSGVLKGLGDFTGYNVVLLGKNGTLYGSKVLGKGGMFSFSGFDIGILERLAGYKYEVYDKDDKLVLQGDLR